VLTSLPAVYRRKVAELQKVLDDETTRPHAVEIIRSLIDHIDVRPGLLRGRCEVVVVGALAQILAFAHQHTTATASSGTGGTFSMVAGARFSRHRTSVHMVAREGPASI